MRVKQREKLTYVIFGFLTTVINIMIYAFLTNILTVEYKAAVSIAWIISVLFAYITNKIYVFRTNSNNFYKVLQEMGSFFTVRLISYIIDIILMIFLIEVLNQNDLLAKVFVNVLIIIMNFYASKYLVFRAKRTTEQGQIKKMII